LTTHESIARNKVIAKALDWAGYVERSGHGTEFIIEKCEAQGLATPQYKPDFAIFHTIIWRKTETVHQVGGVRDKSGTSQGQVRGTSQGHDMSLFERITSILADQVLSSGDITAALGKEYYSGHLRRIIKMLLSDGIIEYTIPEKPRSRLQKYRLTEKGRQMLAQKGTHK
jgi:ATP-dependent DNA helicase RecG